ncbi:hypothetical protein [Streptacidiphilus monticola]|uniref:SWIM-type domain-containing protein n=1 Tax=Streptacidiphilus monticola TaxID=2161674 RepID=A0ABW1G9Z0_9ACTN
MVWDGVGADVEGHRGSAEGRLVDGAGFTYRAGQFAFLAEPGRPGPGGVEERRILHVQPECSCGWQGDPIPCGGQLVPAGDDDWALPEEGVTALRDAWDGHVTAVADPVVPPWHTIRWGEQNLALRELTAQQPRAALRLLRKLLADAEAHRLDAIVSARRQGASWDSLSRDLGLDEGAVQELYERAASRW